MKKDQHVVPYKDGWAVKEDFENDNYSSIHKTQFEAVEAARKIAKKDKSEVIVHRNPNYENITSKQWNDNNPHSQK